MARENVVSSPPTLREEPFAIELATALDYIDTLTSEECSSIKWAVRETGCEPLTVFLALHASLSYVLASPHGVEFRSLLRSWGANRLLDSVISEHWKSYRPRYRPGSTLTANDLDWLLKVVTSDCLICVRPSPIATALCEQRGKNVRASIHVGDTFRYRYDHWSPGEWSDEQEVFGISSRGSLWCRKPGRKSKQTHDTRFFGDPRVQIEIVRRAASI